MDPKFKSKKKRVGRTQEEEKGKRTASRIKTDRMKENNKMASRQFRRIGVDPFRSLYSTERQACYLFSTSK